MDERASYGRACSQCARAKAKCTVRAAGDGQHPHSNSACDRCVRLNKACQPATGARRKPGRKPGSSKTDALEARLNGIMNMLETAGLQPTQALGLSAAPAPAHAHAPAPAHTQKPLPSPPPRAHTLPTYSPHEMSIRSAGPPSGAYAGTMASGPGPVPVQVQVQTQAAEAPRAPSASSAGSADGDDDDGYGLSDAEAEAVLARFRRKLTHFPFVLLPDGQTAAQLRQVRPLLWLSIVAAAAANGPLQDRLCVRLRQAIADQAVVQHVRSLDLLLGILGFLGWGMYHSKGDPFMAMYCHLAAAVAHDLGLDREPKKPLANGPHHKNHPLQCVRQQASKARAPPADRTDEERRAVLGASLFTGAVALFHRTPSLALAWTEHLDDCVAVLAASDAPQDRVLAYQCRLQRVAMDVPGPGVYTNMPPHIAHELRAFHEASLLAQQAAVEALMPRFDDPELTRICALGNVANASAIYSIALYTTGSASCAAAPSSTPDSTADVPKHVTPHVPDPDRARMLHACLRRQLEWFNLVFGTGTFVQQITFPLAAQLSYFLVVVYRLATLADEPAWDALWARKELNILGILDRIETVFREASRVERGDTFCARVKAMSVLRANWASILDDPPASVDTGPAGPSFDTKTNGVDGMHISTAPAGPGSTLSAATDPSLPAVPSLHESMATPSQDHLQTPSENTAYQWDNHVQQPDPSGFFDGSFPLGDGITGWMADVMTDWQVSF